MAEFVYEGSKTKEISFPLGGISSGCIGLAGDGRLVDWEIFNRPSKGSANGYTHFAVKAEQDGQVLDARVLQGDLLPPYTGSLKATAGSTPFGSGPPRSFLSAAPHFRAASFRGEFPIARLSLRDGAFPGAVTITAFNPFIPLNDRDSSIPAAFFEIEIDNSHDSALTYTVCVSVHNPVPGAVKINRFQHGDGLSLMGMTARGSAADDAATGDLTIATDASEVSYQEYWRRTAYKGIWIDDVSAYWRDLTTPGRFANRGYEQDLRRRGAGIGSAHSLLAAHLQVNPGCSGRARFLLAWNFPVYTNYWNPAPYDPGSDPANGKAGSNTWRNYYATLWKDSRDTAQYALSNWDRLFGETTAFKEALFSSTLPAAVVDAISANLSVLKSPTVLRLQDGTFYGFEGCHPDAMCCEGSCSHVWNYAYALPFLFPRLERGMRSVWRYNFVRQMRHTFNPRRVFSLNDESGVLTCSYPRGRPNTVIPFAEETMSGFEYQVAGHMIQEGLVDEGIAIVEAIRARYDGEKRNPWNEMECGSNYARAMSSYALLLALSGFEFDMTKGEIGFHPKQFGGTHRFFWCLHSAWGTVELHADRIILSVLHGSMALRRFNAGALLERDVTAATLDGQELPYAKRQQSVILAEPAHLEAGSVLRLDLHNNNS